MSWLALSILSATGIFFCFGLFSRVGVDNRLAIAVNYTIAAILGFLINPVPLSFLFQTKMLLGVLVGAAFYFLFMLIAWLTQKGGIAIGTISSQMSLVIPVSLAPFLYDERFGVLRILGILAGLSAIYLMARQDARMPNKEFPLQRLRIAALVVFLGTGICMSLIKFSRATFVTDEFELGFVAFVFSVSAVSSWLHILMTPKKWYQKKKKSVLAGIALGVPNLGSLYFLIRALATPGLDSSLVFPVNNIGIVMSSTLVGWMVFKEHLGVSGRWGVFFAIIGVILVSL